MPSSYSPLPLTWPERMLRLHPEWPDAESVRADEAAMRVAPDWRWRVTQAIHRLGTDTFVDERSVRENAVAHFHAGLVSHFAVLPSVVAVMHAGAGAYDALPERYSEAAPLPVPGLEEAVWPPLYDMYAVVRWLQAGRHVYHVDPATFELLLHTDLPEMPSRYVRSPLPAFWFQFPPDRLFFSLDSEQEDDETLRGPMGNPTGRRTSIDGVMVCFSDPEPSESVDARTLTCIIGGHPSESATAGPFMTACYALDEFPVKAPGVYDTGDGTPIPKANIRQTLRVQRVVFNLLLYLMQEHPDLVPVPPPKRRKFGHVRSPKERQKAEAREDARLSGLSRTGYVYVGRPDDVRVEAAPAGSTGRKLDHLVWVRGHWRNQAFGPQRAYRRMIHIRPFLKGPDALASRTLIKTIQPATTRDV